MTKILVISGILLLLHGVTCGWLKYHAIPVKWEEAALRCYYEGSILASPLNEEISTALIDIMVDHGVMNRSIHSGISNIHTKSEFQSMEGVPLSNICVPWLSEPNDIMWASQNSCIVMDANETAKSVSCTDRHPFACYRKAGIELNECGPVNTEFVLDNRIGSCYKAVNEQVTWEDAFKHCARMGAHLAVINSEVEAEVIYELAKNIVPETGNFLDKYVNIGFRAWDVPRAWITIHGQSLKDSGYAKWAPNQPNNPSERCGTLYTGGPVIEGLLNDAPCTFDFKFICELNPKTQAITAI